MDAEFPGLGPTPTAAGACVTLYAWRRTDLIGGDRMGSL